MDVNLTTLHLNNFVVIMVWYFASPVPTLHHKMEKPNECYAPLITAAEPFSIMLLYLLPFEIMPLKLLHIFRTFSLRRLYLISPLFKPYFSKRQPKIIYGFSGAYVIQMCQLPLLINLLPNPPLVPSWDTLPVIAVIGA